MDGNDSHQKKTTVMTYTTCRYSEEEPDYLICTEQTEYNSLFNGKTNNKNGRKVYKVRKSEELIPFDFNDNLNEELQRQIDHFHTPFLSLFDLFSDFYKPQAVPVKYDNRQPDPFYYSGDRKPDSKIYDL